MKVVTQKPNIQRSSCSAANWTTLALDQAGDVGAWGSTALDAEGRLHAIYYDATAADLKYIR
jgi:hypothetical protein